MKNIFGDDGDTKYLLLHRWIIINTIGCVALGIVWQTGWIAELFANDTAYLSRIVLCFFLLAVVFCTVKLWKISRELNIARQYTQFLVANDEEACRIIEAGNSRLASYLQFIAGRDAQAQQVIVNEFRLSMKQKISGVGYNLSRLMTLGLIGTFVGISFALKGFDPAMFTDPSKLVELFVTVPPGMRMAMFPSIVAMLGTFWLDYLFEILQDGTNHLITEVVKAGVYRGR